MASSCVLKKESIFFLPRSCSIYMWTVILAREAVWLYLFSFMKYSFNLDGQQHLLFHTFYKWIYQNFCCVDGNLFRYLFNRFSHVGERRWTSMNVVMLYFVMHLQACVIFVFTISYSIIKGYRLRLFNVVQRK